LSTVEQTDIQKIHEQWWKWIFTTKDDVGHPLRGNHAVKQAQNGDYLLAGTLPKEEKELLQPERRQIEIPVGASVFIPVDNVLCTETEKDPEPLADACAKADIDGAEGKILARLNGQELEPNQIIRTRPHTFRLNITQLIKGTRKDKTGEPLGETGAAADGYCAIFKLPPLLEGKDYHEFEIKGRGIWVTYQISPPAEKQ
jgi:hypothetical protein